MLDRGRGLEELVDPVDLGAGLGDGADRLARRRVERLFTLDRMIDGYEALYAGALAARKAMQDPVRFPEIELPERLVAAWDRSKVSQAI